MSDLLLASRPWGKRFWSIYGSPCLRPLEVHRNLLHGRHRDSLLYWFLFSQVGKVGEAAKNFGDTLPVSVEKVCVESVQSAKEKIYTYFQKADWVRASKISFLIMFVNKNESRYCADSIYTSSRIVRVAAAIGLAQEFQKKFPPKVKIKNSMSSVYVLASIR